MSPYYLFELMVAYYLTQPASTIDDRLINKLRIRNWVGETYEIREQAAVDLRLYLASLNVPEIKLQYIVTRNAYRYGKAIGLACLAARGKHLHNRIKAAEANPRALGGEVATMRRQTRRALEASLPAYAARAREIPE